MEERSLTRGLPRTEDQITQATGMAVALADVVGALARHDGTITPHEYAALARAGDAIAALSDNPLLMDVLLLRSLWGESTVKASLATLKAETRNLDSEARPRILRGLLPLLACQGDEARTLATACATALGVSRSDRGKIISDLKEPAGAGLVGRLTELWSGRDEMLARARALAGMFSDDQLRSAIAQAEGIDPGPARDSALSREMNSAVVRAMEGSKEILPSESVLDQQALAAIQFRNLADALVGQVDGRIRAVEARITLQKRMFHEDLVAFVEAAVDAVDLGMRNRVEGRDVDWADETIWKRFAETEAAARLVAKYEPIQRRYEDIFSLWESELEDFSKEVRRTAAAVLENVAPSAFAGLVKTEHLGTTLKNQLDRLADGALGAGAAVAAAGVTGTAVAIYTGAVSVAGVIAAATATLSNPFGWAVLTITGGTLGLAALWKWFSDPNARKRALIQEKREAIRAGLNALLGDPGAKHDAAADEVVKRFIEAAREVYAPLVRDAHLAVLKADLERRARERVLTETARLLHG